MRSDEKIAFWSAIREAPEDDAPRLVYADWLDDHGQSDRAEFIRVQCALAKLGPDRRKGRKERVRLDPREKTLLARFGERWLAPHRAVLRGSNPWDLEDRWLDRLQFRRGLLNGQHFGLESARRLAAAGDTVEPVDHVFIMECGAHYCHESVVEIARWQGAGCVVGLSVAWGADRDIAAIVRFKRVRNLRHLGVWHGKVTDKGMVKLAAWPFAKTLQSVDFKDNRISDAGAFALADSPHFGELRWLDLHGTHIGRAGRGRLRKRFGDALKI
jgi:uncharacterized protein (TIGR02996 family)